MIKETRTRLYVAGGAIATAALAIYALAAPYSVGN
jgi:hypothetical protein